MNTIKRQEAYLNSNQFLRNVAVDNVIFGYSDKQLKVLLQRPFAADKWTVAGGHIKKTETIEDAAKRIAYERTGLKKLYLEQFRSFGTPTRNKDAAFNARQLSKLTGLQVPADLWIFDYFVTVGFYTLTEFSKVEIKKSALETDCRWWPIADLPKMMFDHKTLIAEALKSLRLHIAHHPIGYELLPNKFTLPEIHNLYESILGRSLDDRNFSKKLIAAGILVKLDEKKQIGSHRSPFLYRFDKEKYEEGLKSGVTLAF